MHGIITFLMFIAVFLVLICALMLAGVWAGVDVSHRPIVGAAAAVGRRMRGRSAEIHAKSKRNGGAR
jgi:hypothetical protein